MPARDTITEMQPLRWEEERARAMIERALGVPVKQHDDGSKRGMYDLDVLYPDRPPAAVEITAAMDAESVELWKLMNESGERWQVEGLAGGWEVSVLPSARKKQLYRGLPDLLLELERSGIRELRVEQRSGQCIEEVARKLGVLDAVQCSTSYPGSIYILVEDLDEQEGSIVPETGNALAMWLGEFLSGPEREDVRKKLAQSGAVERHAFVFVPDFSIAPSTVELLLNLDGTPLPAKGPQLPAEITDVWAASTLSSSSGFRWSPSGGWLRFDKMVQ